MLKALWNIVTYFHKGDKNEVTKVSRRTNKHRRRYNEPGSSTSEDEVERVGTGKVILITSKLSQVPLSSDQELEIRQSHAKRYVGHQFTIKCDALHSALT